MRDPLALAEALLVVFRMVQDRDEKIARLEEDNAALDQTLTDTEERLRGAELRIAQWEAAASAMDPAMRPS